MRRALSALLLTRALLAGTAALAAHVVDEVAVGPHRAAAAVRAALDSPGSRSALRHELVKRIAAQVPGLSTNQAGRAADRILADPMLPAAAQALATSSDAQRSRAVDDALSTLARRDPALAHRLRQRADQVLPALRLPVLHRLHAARQVMESVRTLGTVAAAVLGVLALVVGPRRGRLLGRIGVWAIVMGVLGLAFVALAPGLLVGGTALWADLAAAAIQAARASLVPLFVGLLVGGVVLVVVGALVRLVAGRGRGRSRAGRALG
jgi:hypothetical protein